jgi:hypothetical protein
MNSATRVLAMIAMGGGMAGAAVAVSQVPAPQATTTVAVSGPSATDAVQQLADESARLHVAIASAQTQLAQLRANVATPSASPDLADLLAQADSQLAIARQRIAADEALLAKLHAVAPVQRPSAAAPTPTYPNRRPAPAEAPSASLAARQSAESAPTATTPTPTATTPTRQGTQSPSPLPTNRGGDD